MGFLLPENITWKELESGFVLLNLSDGAYYTLNETASSVFRCILENKDENGIVSDMLAEYNVDQNHVAADIKELLGFLKSEGLAETAKT
jgi:hypothetical protein